MQHSERVRITVEFELPQTCNLEECQRLVMHQMRTGPIWDDPSGTGNLNYICYDRTMRVVEARIVHPPA